MEVQLAQKEREFVKVYKDFLLCKHLTPEERLVHIALKAFVTYGHDSGQVYPSMESICKLTGMTRPRATRAMNSLVKKGIVTKKRRGLTKTNLYTVADNEAMWRSETLEDLKESAVSTVDLTTQELIEELKRRGIEVVETKKEPRTTTDQSMELDTFQKSLSNKDNNMNTKSGQDTYSMEFLKDRFNYDLMVNDNPLEEKMIDYVLQIIYDTVNSDLLTVRVQKTNRPKDLVVGVLLKLSYMDIMYVIRKYNENKTRIEYPKQHLLTQLYEASGQHEADIRNRVSHDLYGGE